MPDRTIESLVPPRIVMHTSEPSGLGHYVSKLVLALNSAGVPVVLFCPSNSRDEAAVRAAGVPVVHSATRGTSNAGILERLVRNLRFLVKTALIQSRLVRRDDVVHFQDLLHLPLGFVFLFLAILKGGSVVLTAHDPLPHRWRFPRGLRWLERSMLYFSYKLFDRIIVHNLAGRNALVNHFHIEEHRISVIPHGLYADAAALELSYPVFDCLRLLAFGSIRENKGVHLAIEAVQMSSDLPVPVRLTIAGHCDPAEMPYWKTCQQVIAANPERIEVIDRTIADDEIGALLARHHALILPYTEFHSESGVAVLGLSHRRPILATKAGGLAEIISAGNCGIPIDSTTAQSVADAIFLAVMLGPGQLRQMGIEGLAYLQKTRSWDSVANQTAQLYSQSWRKSILSGTRFFRILQNLQGRISGS